MNYPAKKDWFVTLLFITLGPGSMVIGGTIIYGAVQQNAPLPLLLAGCVPLVSGALLLWLLFASGCDISPPDLIIRFGPLRWLIPLDALVEVRPKSPYSLEMGWNFALSLNKLLIKYRKPDGRVAAFGIYVAVEDREGFLHELAQVAPQAKIEGLS